jgi:hypothetical protein
MRLEIQRLHHPRAREGLRHVWQACSQHNAVVVVARIVWHGYRMQPPPVLSVMPAKSCAGRRLEEAKFPASKLLQREAAAGPAMLCQVRGP